jgi:ADP-heptose:LPS heptosyltransferase
MHLTLVGLPWADEFASMYPHYFDAFVALPNLPGLHEPPLDADAIQPAFNRLQGCRFDVAVQMHGDGSRSNAALLAMGARFNAGYYPPGAPYPPHGAFTVYPDDGTEVARNLALVANLGATGVETSLEMPIATGDRARAAALLAESGVAARPYVCIHPGAKLASRRWPAERFAAVARSLSGTGYGVVVTGTAAESAFTAVVSRAVADDGGSSADLAGKTDLRTLAATVAGSDLVVSNDTGIAHIAAATGTPTVVVACGSDTRRWAAGGEGHLTLAHPIECRPCLHDACPIGHPCALAITPEMVFGAAGDLLATTAAAGRPR